MVIDTSILLSIVFNEPHAQWCVQSLERCPTALRMSTVNLSEFLIISQHRQPQDSPEIERQILSRGIRFVPPSVRQAQIAAKARNLYPLNLGDCFAYALAADEGCAVLTLDIDFKRTDLTVVSP